MSYIPVEPNPAGEAFAGAFRQLMANRNELLRLKMQEDAAMARQQQAQGFQQQQLQEAGEQIAPALGEMLHNRGADPSWYRPATPGETGPKGDEDVTWPKAAVPGQPGGPSSISLTPAQARGLASPAGRELFQQEATGVRQKENIEATKKAKIEEQETALQAAHRERLRKGSEYSAALNQMAQEAESGGDPRTAQRLRQLQPLVATGNEPAIKEAENVLARKARLDDMNEMLKGMGQNSLIKPTLRYDSEGKWNITQEQPNSPEDKFAQAYYGKPYAALQQTEQQDVLRKANSYRAQGAGGVAAAVDEAHLARALPPNQSVNVVDEHGMPVQGLVSQARIRDEGLHVLRPADALAVSQAAQLVAPFTAMLNALEKGKLPHATGDISDVFKAWKSEITGSAQQFSDSDIAGFKAAQQNILFPLIRFEGGQSRQAIQELRARMAANPRLLDTDLSGSAKAEQIANIVEERFKAVGLTPSASLQAQLDRAHALADKFRTPVAAAAGPKAAVSAAAQSVVDRFRPAPAGSTPNVPASGPAPAPQAPVPPQPSVPPAGARGAAATPAVPVGSPSQTPAPAAALPPGGPAVAGRPPVAGSLSNMLRRPSLDTAPKPENAPATDEDVMRRADSLARARWAGKGAPISGLYDGSIGMMERMQIIDQARQQLGLAPKYFKGTQ